MEYLSSLLCQATRLAAEAHDGAFRKGSRMPYLLHAMETAEIVATMTMDEDVLAAAVLHDVLEDTSVTEEAMRNTVGGHVTELVMAVSEDKRAGQPPEETWRVRKQESVERLLRERRLEVKMLVLGTSFPICVPCSGITMLWASRFGSGFTIRTRPSRAGITRP